MREEAENFVCQIFFNDSIVVNANPRIDFTNTNDTHMQWIETQALLSLVSPTSIEFGSLIFTSITCYNLDKDSQSHYGYIELWFLILNDPTIFE